MKRTLLKFAIIVASVVSMIPALSNASTVKGGYVDSEKGTIALMETTPSGGSLLISQGPSRLIKIRPGKLIIVTAYGTYKEMATSFKDRFGTIITMPVSSTDKVVFIDKYSAIRGGVGLTKTEIAGLIKAQPADFGAAATLYSRVNDLFAMKIDAIRKSTPAFKAGLSKDDAVDNFQATVAMLAGKDFANAIADVVSCASTYDSVDSIGRTVETATKVVNGIDLLDDIVSQEGNGGNDLTNPIAQEGNGGNDIEAIVQGWSIDPSIPAIPSIGLNLSGSMIMLVD